MSMVYLANVPCIETDKGLNFYTPHEHVAVDWPSADADYYSVWSFGECMDVMLTRDFAKAMDTAARWLKLAEPA